MKQENKTETNARSSFLGILPNLNFVTATKEKKSLVDIHESNFFSRFGIHQGVQVMSKPHSLRLVGLALLGLLTSHLVGTSLIHSAYAASYVNVSSGGGNSGTSSSETVSPGIVNLGSIKPTSTGTMATGNDTLTIHTDCSAGYKVYVSGQNGKSTNLINSNAEDPTSPEATELISSASNLPNSTSATSSPSSAATLNSNTWGINGNNTEAENNLYYGLPPYSDATAYPLVTKSNVPEESTVPIYYGVKVDTTLSPGTYTGNILYTVLINNSCLAYTVVFSPNVESSSSSEITGTMPDQSITYGETTPLDANAFSREGYTFLGWSTSANGKTGTVTNGIGTVVDIDYEDTSNVLNLTSGGGIITLYAIWEKDLESMQDWDGCSSLNINDIVELKDIRDGATYKVKKTPDNKCWMIQNLTIAGVPLTPEDTNISDGKTYYLPPKNTRYTVANAFNNNTISPDILNSTAEANFQTSNSNQVQVGYRDEGSVNNDTGNKVPEDTAYYNFYTATLGFSYYGDTTRTSGTSPQDICPKGWRLPKVTDSGSTVSSGSPTEFATLAKSYNPSASWANSSSAYNYSTNDSSILSNMIAGITGSKDRYSNENGSVGFTFSGYFSGNYDNNPRYVGDANRYRSASVYDNNDSYVLLTNSAGIYPQYWGNKINGDAVRCVKESKTMQNTSCSSLPVGQTSTLVDARDNQEYTVYRFPNTGTAGTDYPSGMSGYCLMTKDLSLGYVTGGSITKGSNLTLTTDTSAGSGTIAARTGTGNWNLNNDNNNLQYINGPQSGQEPHSSHSYYSYGAAQAVCPTEWRLLTKTEYDNIVAFVGGDNSTGSAKIRSAPYNFIYGGHFASAGWNDVGNNGRYWSSTQDSNTNIHSYYLYLYSSNLSTKNNGGKSGGYSVRCIKS